MELKIPPVVLVIIFALAMRLGSAFAPIFNFRLPFQSFIACVFALLGIVVAASGFREFRRAKTTANPIKPEATSSLVTKGIYRRTRNPMYLGFLLVLIGWAIGLANLMAFLFLPGFVAYMNRFQIEPEERTLRSIFGDEFILYCTAVRRWI